MTTRFALVVAALVAATLAGAKTPDGLTPAVETSCDDLEGAARGICVAFCEAQDCEMQSELDTSCQELLDHFRAITGHDPPCLNPCLGPGLARTYDVSIEINTDDQYCLYSDDSFVDCEGSWPITGTYHFPMISGCHVLAVEAQDVFGLISATIAVVRVDGAVVSLTGDGTWKIAPVEPPPAGWRAPGFDDSAWTSAIACTDTSPWGGAPAPLRAQGAQWVWDDPAGDCYAALGEVYFRLDLTLP